ncbi:hypothetical protein PINS_up007403 [Pythium insidiosum]|nr:hypothetical protein PINS_up007403 [Pythium insidiosum]
MICRVFRSVLDHTEEMSKRRGGFVRTKNMSQSDPANDVHDGVNLVRPNQTSMDNVERELAFLQKIQALEAEKYEWENERRDLLESQNTLEQQAIELRQEAALHRNNVAELEHRLEDQLKIVHRVSQEQESTDTKLGAATVALANATKDAKTSKLNMLVNGSNSERKNRNWKDCWPKKTSSCEIFALNAIEILQRQ